MKLDDCIRLTHMAEALGHAIRFIEGRTRADLDALNELTRVVTAPAWASAVEVNRDSVRLFGEAPQAPPLLRLIDQSPLFEGSEFTMPLAKTQGGETFGIRSRREGALP